MFFSYAVVTPDEALLFSDIKDASVVPEGVTLRPYADVWSYLPELGARASSEHPVLLGKRASLAIAHAIGRVRPGLALHLASA